MDQTKERSLDSRWSLGTDKLRRVQQGGPSTPDGRSGQTPFVACIRGIPRLPMVARDRHASSGASERSLDSRWSLGTDMLRWVHQRDPSTPDGRSGQTPFVGCLVNRNWDPSPCFFISVHSKWS